MIIVPIELSEPTMNERTINLKALNWQEIFPWTMILKTLSIAASPSVIALALLGALLNPIGWLIGETIFFGEAQRNNTELMEVASINASAYRSVFDEAARTSGVNILGIEFNGPRLIFNQMVRRFGSMFDQSHQGREFYYFAFGNVWSILVWSFIGLAIARIGLVRLTRNEHVGMDDAFWFACNKWATAAGAMAIPLAGVFVLCLPCALAGFMMGFDFGVILVGLFWIILLMFGLVMALLLLGLAVGWPLMVASVAAESQNSFDAMTRAYAYVFQRPLHYLFYCFIAILFGGFCWMIVSMITNGSIDLAYWAISWGTALFGAERIEMIQGYTSNSSEIPKMLDNGTNLMAMWNAFVRTFAVAFIYGLFWLQAAVIYLLLRKDVDETEMDEIYIDEEQRRYSLPSLKTDEQGIPQVKSMSSDDTVIE